MTYLLDTNAIAAIAKTIGATLVTRDSDFQRVAGLSVEDWTLGKARA